MIRAASAEEMEDLATATAALKAKGKAADEIASRLEQAGWSRDFSTWYAQLAVSNADEIRLVEANAGGKDLEAKRAGQRMTGIVLATLGTLWTALGPLVPGVKDFAVLAAILGIGLLWEGFSRLALSKGLSRLHGICAITVLIVDFVIFYFFLMPLKSSRMLSSSEDRSVEYTGILAAAIILPAGLSWLMFRLSIDQEERKLRKAAAG